MPPTGRGVRGISEHQGVVRVPRRVFQRLLPERPTPGRCLEAYYLQRTRFEGIIERKIRRRQLTDDGNVKISGRDFAAKFWVDRADTRQSVSDRREAPTAHNRPAARTADQIASLKPFATRNATFFDALLALIWISSPVAGLRPLRGGRAGRIRTCRTPRLGMRILLPFFSTRPMSATKPVNISIACFLATP